MQDTDLRLSALAHAMEYYKDTPIPPDQIIDVAEKFLSFLKGSTT